MELLAVKLEKKQNGITEVYAEKKILGSDACGGGIFTLQYEYFVWVGVL